MTNSNVSLDDKYSIESGRIFVTGVQALARIPMVQRQRDVLAVSYTHLTLPTSG